jgi:uncharacterized SAM-binding protein YcdF (DUF218 family)
MDEQSNTTQENALQSAKVLHQESIKTICLATHFGMNFWEVFGIG